MYFLYTAFVEFEDEEGAKKALSLSGRLLINNIQVVLQRRGGPDVPPKASTVRFFFFPKVK